MIQHLQVVPAPEVGIVTIHIRPAAYTPPLILHQYVRTPVLGLWCAIAVLLDHRQHRAPPEPQVGQSLSLNDYGKPMKSFGPRVRVPAGDPPNVWTGTLAAR